MVDVTPERLSFGTRVKVTSLLFHAGGAVTVVTGAVLSIFTAGALVAFVLSAGAATIPLSASAAVQWTLTFPLYQPAAFGDVVGAPDSVGAVLSILATKGVVLVLLSALSTAVPVTEPLLVN